MQALIVRGVAPSTARNTVKQFPASRIQPQLEVFDYLVGQKDAKISRNPPGFLISAIRGEYAPPKDFLSHEEMARQKEETEQRRAREARRRELQEIATQAKEEAQQCAIEQFWRAHSALERERMEQDALTQVGPVQRKMLDQGGTLAAATRKALLDAYALRIMRESN